MRRHLAESSEGTPARVLSPGALLELVRGVVGSGGSIWIRVTGISMNPVLREGDSVLLAAPRRRVRRGDVVFLDVEGTPLLHRVRRHEAGVLVTRGDAACRDDDRVSSDACIAQAVASRRGALTVALTLTLRFGVVPFLRMLAWKVRAGVPSSMFRTIQPLSRAVTRARS